MKYIRFIPALLLVSCTGTIDTPDIPEPEPAAAEVDFSPSS